MDRSCAPSPLGTKRELWDCAISDAQAAEDAVRYACEPAGVILITARTPLTEHEVDELGLQDLQYEHAQRGSE